LYTVTSYEHLYVPDLNLLGTPWATSACCGITFTSNQYDNIRIVANGCIKRVVKNLSVRNIRIMILNR